MLASHPDWLPALLGLGLCARQRGDRAAAAALFERALQLDPAAPSAALELASELRDQGETGRALALAGAVLARDPRNAAAGIAVALAQRQSGQAEAAQATLRALLAAEPAHVNARLELAQLDMRLGRPDQAAALLEQVLADAPECCRALEQLAELARIGRDHARAQALLLRSIALQPSAPAPRLQLSQTLADLGRLADALAALDEAEAALAPEDANRAAVAAKRVELLRRAGEWPAALELARRARESWPRHFQLWVQATLTELHTAGPQAVTDGPDAAPACTAAERARVCHLRGQAAEAAWQLDAAIGHYAAALDITPDDAGMHLDITRAQMLRLEAADARAHLRAATRLLAGTARLERRSANVSQTHYGQLLDEHELDAEALAALAALRDLPAAGRIGPLLALLRDRPDFTPAAVALLVALRQSGRLATGAPDGAACPIPRRIAQFWDDPAPPTCIAGGT